MERLCTVNGDCKLHTIVYQPINAFFCQQRAIGGNREGHIVFPSLLSFLNGILNERIVNERLASLEGNAYRLCLCRLGDKVVDGLNVALTECPTAVDVVALIFARVTAIGAAEIALFCDGNDEHIDLRHRRKFTRRRKRPGITAVIYDSLNDFVGLP